MFSQCENGLPGGPERYTSLCSAYQFMGRPKGVKEEVRSKNYTIRLTKEEQKRLESAAEICGVTPAVLIRRKLFKGKFPEAKTPRIDLNAYAELKKIGVNLNQLAKKANSGILPRELLPLIMKLLNQQETIISKILYRDSQSENR